MIRAGLTLMASEAWCLDYFAERNAMYAHGVLYSPFWAICEPRQKASRARTAQLSRLRRARHVTEHVGFATVPGMLRGAPLPPLPCRASVQTARAHLDRIAETVGQPVGLENLAMAFCRYDVQLQGDMLEALLAPHDAPFLLDVHNLYCQAVNFGCDARALLDALPLHPVREIHVSGGS